MVRLETVLATGAAVVAVTVGVKVIEEDGLDEATVVPGMEAEVGDVDCRMLGLCGCCLKMGS